jgi:hypothetical protein
MKIGEGGGGLLVEGKKISTYFLLSRHIDSEEALAQPKNFFRNFPNFTSSYSSF